MFLFLLTLSACGSENNESASSGNGANLLANFTVECSADFKQTTDLINTMQPEDASDFIFPISLRESFYNKAKNCLSKIEPLIIETAQTYKGADKSSKCFTSMQKNKSKFDKTKVNLDAYNAKALDTVSHRLHAFKDAKDFMTAIDGLKISSETTFNSVCANKL